ncbi:MAG: hypothetical protein J0M24_26670 [Verrucomicrobia bacterium]|nr:hypothetical protein [Verrucomicrobiota bacterium]
MQAVRDALLALHKALVDSERIGYEEAMGPIPSPNHFLKLLTSDPWFAWLQPLARLIVSMDTALDAKEPLTPDKVQQFLQKTREILVVSEEGDGFPRSYFEALQRDPDVVFAHARVASLLR